MSDEVAVDGEARGGGAAIGADATAAAAEIRFSVDPFLLPFEEEILPGSSEEGGGGSCCGSSEDGEEPADRMDADEGEGAASGQV